jgi:Ribosomal protein L7/L12 C-terminal domain
MYEITSEQQATIDELLANGMKIGAIKKLREYTDLGLKEAKDIVDTMKVGDFNVGHAELIGGVVDEEVSGWVQITEPKRVIKKFDTQKPKVTVPEVPAEALQAAQDAFLTSVKASLVAMLLTAPTLGLDGEKVVALELLALRYAE